MRRPLRRQINLDQSVDGESGPPALILRQPKEVGKNSYDCLRTTTIALGHGHIEPASRCHVEFREIRGRDGPDQRSRCRPPHRTAPLQPAGASRWGSPPDVGCRRWPPALGRHYCPATATNGALGLPPGSTHLGRRAATHPARRRRSEWGAAGAGARAAYLMRRTRARGIPYIPASWALGLSLGPLLPASVPRPSTWWGLPCVGAAAPSPTLRAAHRGPPAPLKAAWGAAGVPASAPPAA